jgi:hypothetical protein
VAESYVEEVFRLLARDKALPKNQFERRVDPLLAPFLADILTSWLGGKVVPVVAEFPLKKPDNNQSTNVDHLYAQHGGKDVPPGWVFVELKTDAASVKPNQIDTYLAAIDRGMPALLKDLDNIAAATLAKSKYAELVKRLAPFADLSGPITLVVLAPGPIPSVQQRIDGHGVVHTFSELTDLEVSRHPAEWALFKQRVLPCLT